MSQVFEFLVLKIGVYYANEKQCVLKLTIQHIQRNVLVNNLKQHSWLHFASMISNTIIVRLVHTTLKKRRVIKTFLK